MPERLEVGDSCSFTDRTTSTQITGSVDDVCYGTCHGGIGPDQEHYYFVWVEGNHYYEVSADDLTGVEVRFLYAPDFK